MDAHHDEVHEDEVHCSSCGHFCPQLFHRSGPIVRGEQGGVGEGADLLALDQPHHHLDVQRRVVLQNTHTYMRWGSTIDVRNRHYYYYSYYYKY